VFVLAAAACDGAALPSTAPIDFGGTHLDLSSDAPVCGAIFATHFTVHPDASAITCEDFCVDQTTQYTGAFFVSCNVSFLGDDAGADSQVECDFEYACNPD
jgi:hypothetical protein